MGPVMPPQSEDWTTLVWSAPRVGWALATTGTVLRTADGGHRWSVAPAFGHRAIRHIHSVCQHGGRMGVGCRTDGIEYPLADHGRGPDVAAIPTPGVRQRSRLREPTLGWASGGIISHGRWLRAMWSTRDARHHCITNVLGTVTDADAVMAGVTAASRRTLWATSSLGVNSPPVSAGNHPLARQLRVSDQAGRTWTSVPPPKSVSALTLPQFVGPTAG